MAANSSSCQSNWVNVEPSIKENDPSIKEKKNDTKRKQDFRLFGQLSKDVYNNKESPDLGNIVELAEFYRKYWSMS
jgi:hypothetical protein